MHVRGSPYETKKLEHITAKYMAMSVNDWRVLTGDINTSTSHSTSNLPGARANAIAQTDRTNEIFERNANVWEKLFDDKQVAMTDVSALGDLNYKPTRKKRGGEAGNNSKLDIIAASDELMSRQVLTDVHIQSCEDVVFDEDVSGHRLLTFNVNITMSKQQLCNMKLKYKHKDYVKNKTVRTQYTRQINNLAGKMRECIRSNCSVFGASERRLRPAGAIAQNAN